MVKKIKKYLKKKSRDYDEGLILLSKASKNRILVQRLGRKELKEKLEYELQKIIDREPVVAKKTSKTKTGNKSKGKTTGNKSKGSDKKNTNTAPKDSPIAPEILPVIEKPTRLRVIRGDNKINYDDLPEELKAKWDENAEAYKLARSVHEKLKLMEKATPEERLPLITQLVGLSDKVRANWDVIDAYDPTKVVAPPKDAEKKIDHKRINANRKYISTNLKKFETKPDDKVLKQRIQDRITELVTAAETFKTADKLIELGFEL
ncbi:MAG: hypothetical protein QM503_10690 [Bacteroidota bacterium]